MTSRTSDYRLKDSVFRVTYGDITRITADVIVSSDDTYLSMGGGVSAAIRRTGGKIIAEEARKHTPAELGDVVVTSAGTLPAKYVFHAITVDYSHLKYASEDSIRQATRKCLQLADSLGAKSVVFPALGTGVAKFPFHLAAEVMTATIADYLSSDTNIEIASLTLHAREGVRVRELEVFYERAVALASASTQSKRLAHLLNDLADVVGKMENHDFLNRLQTLIGELEDAHIILSENQEDIEGIEKVQSQIKLGDIGKKVVEATSEARATAAWHDNQLEAEVLRTKLSGLFTQLNVQTSNLNRFEIERAKHGGQLVPPRLETAIAETQKEIDALEELISNVREELVQISGTG